MSKLLTTFVATLFAVSMMTQSVAAKSRTNDSAPAVYEDQDRYIRGLIRKHIGHDPLLEIIFGCESTGSPHRIKHREPDGSLVKNPESSASGYGQVLLKYHSKWIAAEGRNMQDDVEYTKFLGTLFEAQGYSAWNESKRCWGKYAHLGTN